MPGSRVCLGAFAGAHGVRGLVRIKTFTEVPEDVAAYGPLSDEAGARSFQVTVTGRAKGAVLAKVEGVADRDAAEALKGVRLYVDRAALPPPGDADTFYHADLIGLTAETPGGQSLGQVVAVQDYGSGPLLEVRDRARNAAFYPFTRAVVPEIDIAGGRLVIAPPDEA
ncbi:MAG: ribosome maturation factor RimM [Kiloniellales bacterium]|nr:ribosome maturation factor RimM [Kiloniellales bacterium]